VGGKGAAVHINVRFAPKKDAGLGQKPMQLREDSLKPSKYFIGKKNIVCFLHKKDFFLAGILVGPCKMTLIDRSITVLLGSPTTLDPWLVGQLAQLMCHSR
jgi:hypothetical protein